MRYFVILSSIIIFFTSFPVNATEINLNGFRKPDGAITSFFGGNYVDPYFATKSLLIAQGAGIDAKDATLAWINWAIKRQKPDGLFGRYKLSVNTGWETVAESDADDAMLALWLELLYTNTVNEKMPETWHQSVEKAEIQLEKLRNKTTGIYYISESTPVGLLMDNSEIYSAFNAIAKQLQKTGLLEKANIYTAKADELRIHIMAVFFADNVTQFLVSTQGANGNNFYPDKAAQLFPLMYQLIEGKNASERYKEWIKSNAEEWFAQRNEDYPWGLFALLSLKMKDHYNAACWRSHAEPMRYSKHWNILEEIALQVITMHLAHEMEDKHNIPCVKDSFS